MTNFLRQPGNKIYTSKMGRSDDPMSLPYPQDLGGDMTISTGKMGFSKSGATPRSATANLGYKSNAIRFPMPDEIPDAATIERLRDHHSLDFDWLRRNWMPVGVVSAVGVGIVVMAKS